jgi:GDP-L-fucose synthase
MNILIFGGTGTIGKALLASLKKSEKNRILAPSRSELELYNYDELVRYLKSNVVEYLIDASGYVGGIQFNMTNPHDLMINNAITTLNINRAALEAKIGKLIYLAPACIYPQNSESDLRVEDIWKGRPEITSLPYATTKLFGLELVRAANKQLNTEWKVLIPANIFGSFDWEHQKNGHVISMLTDKIFNAKEHGGRIEIWGSGNQRRDFLSASDFAKFICALIENDLIIPEVLNVSGYGEITIKELAELLCEEIGFFGELFFDTDKPEGAARKKLSSNDLEDLNYHHTNSLKSALKQYIADYRSALEAKSQ